MDALAPAPTTLVHGEATFTADPEFRPPAFDLTEVLPPAAADRLRKLRLRAADAYMLMPEHAKLDEANLAKIAAERRLTQLTASAHNNGFNLPETDARVVAAKKTIDKTTADLRRLVELREARTSSWQVISRVAVNVEDWLRSGRPAGTTLEAVETDAKLNKGETVIDAIARFRNHAQELKNTLAKISAAPAQSSLAKARIREQVELLSAKGAPNVRDLIARDDGKLVFPKEMFRAQVFNASKSPAATAYGEIVDPTALVAWLLRDQMIAALDALVDEQKDDAAALSPEIRQQRMATVLTELTMVELGEAALVWKAQAQNLPIEHRTDCGPASILQCRSVVTAPRALPSPASGIDHAFDLS